MVEYACSDDASAYVRVYFSRNDCPCHLIPSPSVASNPSNRSTARGTGPAPDRVSGDLLILFFVPSIFPGPYAARTAPVAAGAGRGNAGDRGAGHGDIVGYGRIAAELVRPAAHRFASERGGGADRSAGRRGAGGARIVDGNARSHTRNRRRNGWPGPESSAVVLPTETPRPTVTSVRIPKPNLRPMSSRPLPIAGRRQLRRHVHLLTVKSRTQIDRQEFIDRYQGLPPKPGSPGSPDP